MDGLLFSPCFASECSWTGTSSVNKCPSTLIISLRCPFKGSHLNLLGYRALVCLCEDEHQVCLVCHCAVLVPKNMTDTQIHMHIPGINIVNQTSHFRNRIALLITSIFLGNKKECCDSLQEKISYLGCHGPNICVPPAFIPMLKP